MADHLKEKKETKENLSTTSAANEEPDKKNLKTIVETKDPESIEKTKKILGLDKFASELLKIVKEKTKTFLDDYFDYHHDAINENLIDFKKDLLEIAIEKSVKEKMKPLLEHQFKRCTQKINKIPCVLKTEWLEDLTKLRDCFDKELDELSNEF